MKRLISLILIASMISSLSPNVYAQDVFEESTEDAVSEDGNSENPAYEEGYAYFEFEQEGYDFKEADKKYKIKVIRKGLMEGEVNVAFKAADFLSSYGDDYVILDEEGKPLPKIEGEKPEMSELVYSDDSVKYLLDKDDSSADSKDDEAQSDKAVISEEEAQDDKAVSSEEEAPADNSSDSSAEEEPSPESEEDKAFEEAAASDDEDTDAAAADAEASEEPDEDLDEAPEDTEAAVISDEAEETIFAQMVDAAIDEPEPEEEIIEEEAFDEEPQESDEQAEISDDDTAYEEDTEIDEPQYEESNDEVVEPQYDEGDYEAETEAADESTAVPGKAAVEQAEIVKNVTDALNDAADKEDSEADPSMTRRTGVPLLDDAYADLGITSPEMQEQTEYANELYGSVYKYLASAEGAAGILHFADGEEEKEITVRIFDNDKAEQNKLFVIALASSDSPMAIVMPTVGVNVTILDDEEYEAPDIRFAPQEISLSEDKPEAEVKIIRNSGIDYFSLVNISTIHESAPFSSYEQIKEKTVSFVPGEKEKTVTVKALDFSENGTFGLKLEGAQGAADAEDYTQISIQKTEAKPFSLLSAPLAIANGSVVLGKSQTNVYLDSMPGGWDHITGSSVDGKWDTPASKEHAGHYDLYLYETKNNGKRGWATNSPQNLRGVKSINYWLYVGGEGSKFTTWFEVHTERVFSGSVSSDPYKGKQSGARHELDLTGLKGSYYIKFLTKPTAGGKHNPKATLGTPLKYNWAKYTLEPQKAATSYDRNIYNFSSAKAPGQPTISHTPYEGEPSYDYYPGPVKITSSNGSNVTGFYGSANDTVTISAPDGLEDKGIYLKGVYFTTSKKSTADIYSGGYKPAKSGMLYKATEQVGGKYQLDIKLNQSFVEELMNADVVESKDSTIRVWPEYAYKNIKVYFGNSDTNGEFNSANLGSYITNVVNEENKKTVNESLAYGSGKRDYYVYEIPVNSVLRLNSTPAANKYPNGINWQTAGGRSQGTEYYKAGEYKFDLSGKDTLIEKDDLSSADIVLPNEGEIYITPNTGTQSLYVGYSPLDQIPEEFKNANGDYDLTGRVIRAENISSDTTAEDIIKSDAKGSIKVDSVFSNSVYRFTTLFPNDYYVQWNNMTGDDDNSGRISPEEMTANPTIRNQTVYGNNLYVMPDQIMPRWYYVLRKKTSSVANTHIEGKVTRRNNTFYGILKNTVDGKDVPVAGAIINACGEYAATDSKGEYRIDFSDGLPTYGDVSAILTVDGKQKNGTATIQLDQNNWRLEALDTFTPTDISLKVVDGNKVTYPTDNAIQITDTEVTITASVTNPTDSTDKAIDARFSAYDSRGSFLWSCSDDGVYNSADPDDVAANQYGIDFTKYFTTTATQSAKGLNATLTFNPGVYLEADGENAFGFRNGDRLYVQFKDSSGAWTNNIDLGYILQAPPKLTEIALPLLGISSVDEKHRYDINLPLMGDVNGDFDMGIVSGFGNPEQSHYLPEDLPAEEAEQYSRTLYDYNYGLGLGFTSSKFQTKSTTDKSLVEEIYNAYQDPDNEINKIGAVEPSGYRMKAGFSWSVNPEVGFNLEISKATDDLTDDDPSNDDQMYFENLFFCLKTDAKLAFNHSIPIQFGFNFMLDTTFNANFTGVYRMYADYDNGKDSEQKATRVPYDGDNFDLFSPGIRDHVRRDGYITLDFVVQARASVNWAKIIGLGGEAVLAFDMDFFFDESGAKSYGDVRPNINFVVTVLSFNVLSLSLFDRTYTMFDSEGQGKHINIDGSLHGDSRTANISTFAALKNDIDHTALTLDKPVERSHSVYVDDVPMAMALDEALDNTTEREIIRGIGEDFTSRIVNLGNNNYLMVYIDDAAERNDVNKSALYYIISRNGTWSAPEMVDDDGTADFGPQICKLADGDVYVTWTNLSEALPEDADVNAELKVADIKGVEFDTSSLTFGTPEELTKSSTDDDYADTAANLVYDSKTGEKILFYVQSQFTQLETAEDLSNSLYSAIAYRTTENGVWQDKHYLNTTTDSTETLPKSILQVNAAGLNTEPGSTGTPYAIFTWVLDRDGDQTTANDEDVIAILYNFEDKTFTKPFRITSETGGYYAPKFVISDNSYDPEAEYPNDVYLFFIKKDAEGDGDNDSINSLCISDVIRDGKYTLNEAGYYYDLKYRDEDYSYTDEDGNRINIPGEDITVEPGVVTACHDMDYSVYADSNGRIYLTWTELDGEACQICAAVYNGYSNDENHYSSTWSEPFTLTEGNAVYSDVSIAAQNGKIYISAEKKENDNKSFVLLEHKPYGNIVVSDITISPENPAPGSLVKVTATVENNGDMATREPVRVHLYDTSEAKALDETITIDESLLGATSREITAEFEMPDVDSDVIMGAAIDDNAIYHTVDTTPASFTTQKKAKLSCDDLTLTQTKEDGKFTYSVSGTVVNIGSETCTNGSLEILPEDSTEPIAEFKLNELKPGEGREFEYTIEIPEEYFINEGGSISTLNVIANIMQDDEIMATAMESFTSDFDAQAVEALKQYQSVNVEGYSVAEGETKVIAPTVVTKDGSKLRVQWLSSDNTAAVQLTANGSVSGISKGSAGLTGIVVPDYQVLVDDGSGYSKAALWTELIPESSKIYVTANVNVTDEVTETTTESSTTEPTTSSGSSSESGGGGGHRSSNAAASSTTEATTEITTAEDTDIPSEPTTEATAGTDNEAGIFKDVLENAWYSDPVKYAYDNGLMAGITTDTFGPDLNLTRAMFVAILYRMEGSPKVESKSGFADVPEDAYYADAVAWASANGIVAGYSDSEYAPDDTITREQMAAMMWRYAKYKGEDVSTGEDNNILSYSDAQTASEYAVPALQWADKEGIISGFEDGTLRPKQTATRAQTATIIKNYQTR